MAQGFQVVSEGNQGISADKISAAAALFEACRDYLQDLADLKSLETSNVIVLLFLIESGFILQHPIV